MISSRINLARILRFAIAGVDARLSSMKEMPEEDRQTLRGIRADIIKYAERFGMEGAEHIAIIADRLLPVPSLLKYQQVATIARDVCTPEFTFAVNEGVLPQAIAEHIVKAASSVLTEIASARNADLERYNESLLEDQAIANLGIARLAEVEQENRQLRAQIATISGQIVELRSQVDAAADIRPHLQGIKSIASELREILEN